MPRFRPPAEGKFRHLATAVCAARCGYPLRPSVRGQRYHPNCHPDAGKPLTAELWAALLAAVPAEPTTQEDQHGRPALPAA